MTSVPKKCLHDVVRSLGNYFLICESCDKVYPFHKMKGFYESKDRIFWNRVEINGEICGVEATEIVYDSR